MLTLTNRIDMRPGAVPLIIHLGQYDSDFSLVFELYSSAGNFTVESGTTAMIRGTKTDGNAYDADATIDVSAKTVTVAGSEQMTAAKGRNVYELVLKKDTKVLSTANFILDVERAAMDADTIASESVLKELNAIIDSAATSTQAAADAASAADRAEDAAESVSSASAQIATNTNDISDLKADLEEQTEESDWIRQKFVILNVDPVDLTPTSNAGIDCIILDCTEGDIFSITASGGNQSRAWAFVDSNNHVLSVADANTQYTDLRITAPANAVKLVVNNVFGSGFVGHVYRIVNAVASLDDRVSALEQLEPGLSAEAKAALLACFERVMWIDDTSGQSAYDDLYNALYGQAPVIEPSYDFEKMEYDVGGGGPSDIYTWTGSTRSLTGHRLFGRNDMTNRARMRTFMPAVSGTITAMPGYEIVAYLFDSIQFESSWENTPKTNSSNKFGNSGGVNFNTSYPAWVSSFTIEDSNCKYVLLCFRKTDNTDWTSSELQNMYGTVFTASLSPIYKLFDIAEYTGGYTYGEGDTVKDVTVVDGGLSHKRTYVRKSAVPARAIVDYLPITNGVFRSADPTKYQICVYQVDAEGGFIWDTENPHGSGGYAIPAWADEYDLSLNPKQNEVFCVCISFKKLDGTDFTQEELSNMYGTVFTYSEGE